MLNPLIQLHSGDMKSTLGAWSTGSGLSCSDQSPGPGALQMSACREVPNLRCVAFHSLWPCSSNCGFRSIHHTPGPRSPQEQGHVAGAEQWARRKLLCDSSSPLPCLTTTSWETNSIRASDTKGPGHGGDLVSTCLSIIPKPPAPQSLVHGKPASINQLQKVGGH